MRTTPPPIPLSEVREPIELYVSTGRRWWYITPVDSLSLSLSQSFLSSLLFDQFRRLRGFLAGAWFHFGFTLWSSEWVYHSLLSRTPPWPDFLIAFITALVPATGLATLLLQRCERIFLLSSIFSSRSFLHRLQIFCSKAGPAIGVAASRTAEVNPFSSRASLEKPISECLRCQTYTALGGDSKPFTFSLSNIENSRLTRPEVSGLNTFKLKGRFGAFVLDKQGEYKRMDILNRLLNRNEEFEEKK
jgi:hypothetical protein